MKCKFVYVTDTKADAWVVPVFEGGTLGRIARETDAGLGGLITRRIASRHFDGANGATSVIERDEPDCPDIILLGMGRESAMSEQSVRQAGAALYRALHNAKADSAVFKARDIQEGAQYRPFLLSHMMDSVANQIYTFNKYKTANDNRAELSITAVGMDCRRVENFYGELSHVTKAAHWARDLGNEPPNVLTPRNYARRIERELLEFDNVKVRMLGITEMREYGMGGALAVNQGSTKNPGCMVVIEYDGTKGRQHRPLGLVGKGVTFDTGGYNLKPGGSMENMKTDMCGSAAVVGAMRALAGRRAAVRAVAVVGLVENMVDGHAFRPSDIITTMSGQTVEIGNTDAEGRLVLADALTYIQRQYDPEMVLDFATLTGAMVVALDDTYTGVFSNDDALWHDIEAAGKLSGEEGWRMPVLHSAFNNAVKGRVADLSNTGAMRGAGASTAAAFLHHFIEKNKDGTTRPWAHFDIAGTSMKGGMASGVGVRWIERFVREEYEREDDLSAAITVERSPGL